MFYNGNIDKCFENTYFDFSLRINCYLCNRKKYCNEKFKELLVTTINFMTGNYRKGKWVTVIDCGIEMRLPYWKYKRLYPKGLFIDE